jgi:hypothetical protein
VQAVPSAAASIPPASLTLPPFQPKTRGRAGVLAVSVVLGLSIAVAGGVTLGRTLARRAPTTAAAAAPAPSPVVATATATPTPTPTPIVAPTEVAASTPLPKAATPVWRRVAPKPTPKSSLTANIPAASGVKDPLEEAIRKAVASTAPAPQPAP